MPRDDSDPRSRLREFAQQRRRFGLRRLLIVLRRDGIATNRKDERRYREEGSTESLCKGRKRFIAGAGPVLALPKQRWSVDFLHDQMATGNRFRILNIVVDVMREYLRAVFNTSIAGKQMVRELADLITERGRPKMIVSDNEPN